MLRLYLLCRPDRTQTVAQRVTDLLRSRYRAVEIIWDAPTVDVRDTQAFARRVEITMQRCDAALVIMGPDWLLAHSPRGLPWQEDPSDPMAVGLAAALRQKKLIVPLLAHGAVMPTADQLAPPLAGFVLHQAVAVRDDPYFLTDLRKVYTQLNTQLSWRPASIPLLLTVIGIVVTFAVATIFDHKPYAGSHFVIAISAILLNLALSFSALIGAFVLAIQRRQRWWLAALIALALAGLLTVVGVAAQVVDAGTLFIWLTLAVIIIGLLALFGVRREMV
jgi:hypothetical protein